MKITQTQRKSKRGVMLVVVLAVGLALIGAAVNPPSASASATGCTWYGHGIKWGVSNGSFCGGISGSGTYVNYINGNFGETIWGLDVLCRASMKVDFYDNWGRWYTWRQGAQMPGCYGGTFYWLPSIPIYSYMRAGFARITLQSYGVSIATVQLGIR